MYIEYRGYSINNYFTLLEVVKLIRPSLVFMMAFVKLQAFNKCAG